jgi:hypothetical protein
MQSLLLPGLAAVVLGPAEKAYWRLTEPLWQRVGLEPPRIVDRPSVYLLPRGLALAPGQLDALRQARWDLFQEPAAVLPSRALGGLQPGPDWGPALGARFRQELDRTRQRLAKLDRRLQRDRAALTLGRDPERLRQLLFPLGRPQERVLPGLFWLRNELIIEQMEARLSAGDLLVLLEHP